MSAERTAQIWRVLGTVTDPEIDESVTALEFITDVSVDDADNVRVSFRLPTYWCAPNFAFLMASDMRDAVSELPWVEAVAVELLDHFSAALINRSVALKKDFREAFPGETDGDLAELRKTFLGKAFERRQELLVTQLRRQGFVAERLTRLRLDDLIDLSLDTEAAGLRSLYLFARRKIFPGSGPETPAFLTLEGTALDAAHFPEHMRRLRGVRITAESNGAICRGLLSARKGQDPAVMAA